MFVGPGSIGAIGVVSQQQTSSTGVPIPTPGVITIPIGSRTTPLSLTLYADFVDENDLHNSYEIRVVNSPSDPVIARVFGDREQHSLVNTGSFAVNDNAGTLVLVVTTQGSGLLTYLIQRVNTTEL